MEINICTKCSSEFTFKRAVCPKCGSRELSKKEIGHATVLDCVHLIATPEPFPDDYSVVMFQTGDGTRGFCRTTYELKSGDGVRIRSDEYGPVCEPE